jgi:hypothetical protein
MPLLQRHFFFNLGSGKRRFKLFCFNSIHQKQNAPLKTLSFFGLIMVQTIMLPK